MVPSVLARATGRLELTSTEMEQAMGGEVLWEGHQEFGFGHAESLTLTWYLNKVSRLDEVIKRVSIDGKEDRGPRLWTASTKRLERWGISERDWKGVTSGSRKIGTRGILEPK